MLAWVGCLDCIAEGLAPARVPSLRKGAVPSFKRGTPPDEPYSSADFGVFGDLGVQPATTGWSSLLRALTAWRMALTALV